MTLFEVHTTPYGRPAVELLALQVDGLKGGDRLTPVTVIVPSNYAAVSTRRGLAGRPGGVANVSFLTLFRLAERLGAASLAAAGRRPLSAPVLGQAVRAFVEHHHSLALYGCPDRQPGRRNQLGKSRIKNGSYGKSPGIDERRDTGQQV